MIYGVILNDRRSLEKIGDLSAAPYKGAAKAPVLYLKPANTLADTSVPVKLPQGADSVEIGATIGLVIGRDASRLSAPTALDHVEGIALAADLSLPHASYYRPAIREKAFDGALKLGPVVPFTALDALTLIVEIDGVLACERRLDDLLRGPAQLLADITDFMTLSKGDVLLVGVLYRSPEAKRGSHVRVSAEGLGSLEFHIAQEKA
jgi:5-oxopent-3-ene-1,2,5-tricarboxylate decarboxylase/2-hydroxyhepta-2,4-diene-1,7-dioate isomerase